MTQSGRLPFAEDAGLFEQGINKGGFAVIDVGNNSYVANGERHR